MMRPVRSESPLSDTRRAMLVAAARLFARDGYAATSMRDLAKEIGITPAALYHHYPDKQALYYAVLELVFTDKATVAAHLLRSDGPAVVRLQEFLSWLIDLLASDQVLNRLLHRELLDGDNERLDFLARQVFEEPYGEIKKLMRRVAPERDPSLSAMSVISLTLGHYELLPIFRKLTGRKDTREERRRFVAHVKALVLGGGTDPLQRIEDEE